MILGAIVGDTVGSVYEFNNIKTQEFPLFLPESAFTDDSVMTIAVADAVMRADRGEARIENALIDRMRAFGQAHPFVGYGERFRLWLYDEDASPYNSWGNGSAMRVSPAAWARETLSEVEDLAAATARVTHDHPEGVKGAQATAACAFLARRGEANERMRAYVRERFGYALDFTLDEIRPSYAFDVSCQGSVPQAITAFLESSGFEDAVRKAVSIGGDSDTIAAITASIAQARYRVPRKLEKETRKRLSADLLAANDAFCKRYKVK